jgi:2-dehydro-3-deoxygalactonokinase
MRGEETQIVGCLDKDDSPRRVFVLPGTHSKWAVVESGRIARFATYMTGELFAVLKEHSILGRLMVGEMHDADSFRRGVVHGGRAGAALLKSLFSARTLPLAGKLPAAGVASYLSGLLVGHEIAEASAWVGAPHIATARPTIVGSAALTRRYAEALAILGIESRDAPENAAIVGIRRILLAAGPLAARR